MEHLVSALVWLFVLSAVTAFCVLAEFSLVGSRRTRIAEMTEGGNTAARIVGNVLQHPGRFFATVQFGITATALVTGSVVEPLLSEFIINQLGLIDVPALHAASATLGSLLGIGFATYVQIVLAELVPRTVALRHAERIAVVVVPPMRLLSSVLRPFLWLLEKSAALVLRLFGINSSASHTERLYSVSELRMLVEQSEKGGVIESEQSDMINAVFSIGDTTVRKVMVPRTEMACIDAGSTIAEAAHFFSTHAHSRVPVYQDTIDHITGVLHVKDLVRALLAPTRTPALKQLLREPFFVPDTQRADELLAQMRTRREYLAVVLDEYGGTAGLVALSDLVARIIGALPDAAQSAPDIQHVKDGSAVINGLTSIGDVNDAFDLNLVDQNYDTIGGYVMGRLSRIPKVGDTVDLKADGVQFRVEEMDKLRVSKVRLTKAHSGP